MKYKMIYDGGSFIDGELHDTLESAIDSAKDCLIEWEAEEVSGWAWDDDKPAPTEEQIEHWDAMIEECICYVVRADDEDEYWLWPESDEQLKGIGWMYWEDICKEEYNHE